MAMPVLAAGNTQWHLHRAQGSRAYAVMAALAGHYHWHLGKIQRSLGHSITAAAAYITGGDVKDARSKKRHDYTERFGVLDTEIVLTPGTPREYLHADPARDCHAAAGRLRNSGGAAGNAGADQLPVQGRAALEGRSSQSEGAV